MPQTTHGHMFWLSFNVAEYIGLVGRCCEQLRSMPATISNTVNGGLFSVCLSYLCGDADDTAGRARARVARLLALLVPALSEIIGSRMDDDGSLQTWDVSILLGKEVSAGSIQRTPRTLCSPISLMKLSVTLPLEFPWASVLKLPRSPT